MKKTIAHSLHKKKIKQGPPNPPPQPPSPLAPYGRIWMPADKDPLGVGSDIIDEFLLEDFKERPL